MRPIKPLHVVAFAALLWLAVYGGQIGGCTLPVIGSPPPFKTTLPLAVLVVEESADRGKLSSGQLDAILSTAPGSVRDYVTSHKGEFRLLDKDETPTLDAPWVQEAFAVKRDSVPWIVAASPRTGLSAPMGAAPEVLKSLEPLGGK